MRGSTRGRGRGSSFSHVPQQTPPQGPLMTGHLQNLDLELELLKRKREMIEQQQQLLETQMLYSERSYNYDTPNPTPTQNPRYFNQPQSSKPTNNYAHLYDDHNDSANYAPFNPRKRPSDPVWEDNEPKRFSASNDRASGVVKRFGSRLGPKPVFKRPRPKEAPKPLMDFGSRSRPYGDYIINKQKSETGRVSKPKSTPPNKLKSYPVEQRKKIVSDAVSVSNTVQEDFILRPKGNVSNKLNGRLELALGHMLKDMKTNFEKEYPQVFQQPHQLRIFKQLLRERIRAVMMNKYVGVPLDVVVYYRKKHPDETDLDFIKEIQMKAALDVENKRTSINNKRVHFIESGNPEEFFKTNMGLLLKTKLREMFDKLKDLYTKEKTKNKEVENIQVKTEENDVPALDLKNANVQETPNDKNDENKTKEVMVAIKDIEKVLPGLLKNYIPEIVELLNMDKQYESTKAVILLKTNAKALNLVGHAKKFEKTAAKQNEDKTEKKEDSGPSRFFVKVMGRPSLPKRKIMQTFLEQYKPKSIKKHKFMHNLLFVGFTTQENADKIVAANGTVLGKTTLSIRADEKFRGAVKPNTSEEKNSSEVKKDSNEANKDSESGPQTEEEQTLNDSGKSEIMSNELEDQISDLLTSIRHAEENEEGNDNNENTNDEIENPSDTSTEIIDKGNTSDQNVLADTADTAVVNAKVNDEDTTTHVNDKNVDDTENINVEPKQELELDRNTEENTKETENQEVIETDQKECETEIESSKEKTEDSEQQTDDKKIVEEESKDGLEVLKTETGRGTPTRFSTRLANSTPSTIRTRRASRLAHGDQN